MLGLKGISRRAVFVIDGSGVIRHREVTASPGDEPNYQLIHEALAEDLRRVAAGGWAP